MNQFDSMVEALGTFLEGQMADLNDCRLAAAEIVEQLENHQVDDALQSSKALHERLLNMESTASKCASIAEDETRKP
jgi:hypothetical protein